MVTISTEHGSIIYTDNALANLVGTSVLEVPGVKCLAAKNATDGICKMLQKDSCTKGITIEGDSKQISVSINIVIVNGNNFSEVAKNIQKQVKHTVESLTELSLKSITVTIQQVVE